MSELLKRALRETAERAEKRDGEFLKNQEALPNGGARVACPCYDHIQEEASKVCEELGDPELQRPVYLLLKYTWNDALDWAGEL